jgi:hypothetical protein
MLRGIDRVLIVVLTVLHVSFQSVGAVPEKKFWSQGLWCLAAVGLAVGGHFAWNSFGKEARVRAYAPDPFSNCWPCKNGEKTAIVGHLHTIHQNITLAAENFEGPSAPTTRKELYEIHMYLWRTLVRQFPTQLPPPGDQYLSDFPGDWEVADRNLGLLLVEWEDRLNKKLGLGFHTSEDGWRLIVKMIIPPPPTPDAEDWKILEKKDLSLYEFWRSKERPEGNLYNLLAAYSRHYEYRDGDWRLRP